MPPVNVSSRGKSWQLDCRFKFPFDQNGAQLNDLCSCMPQESVGYAHVMVDLQALHNAPLKCFDKDFYPRLPLDWNLRFSHLCISCKSTKDPLTSGNLGLMQVYMWPQIKVIQVESNRLRYSIFQGISLLSILLSDIAPLLEVRCQGVFVVATRWWSSTIIGYTRQHRTSHVLLTNMMCKLQ